MSIGKRFHCPVYSCVGNARRRKRDKSPGRLRSTANANETHAAGAVWLIRARPAENNFWTYKRLWQLTRKNATSLGRASNRRPDLVVIHGNGPAAGRHPGGAMNRHHHHYHQEPSNGPLGLLR